MKKLLVTVLSLGVAGVLMVPNASRAQGDAFVVVALVCGGPAPVLGQLDNLTVNGLEVFPRGVSAQFNCGDSLRVNSFEPTGTDVGTPTCGGAAGGLPPGVPISESAVCSVSATVSVSAGPSPPTPPVTCTGSQSSLPLMITCDDTVNHLHLHLIVR